MHTNLWSYDPEERLSVARSLSCTDANAICSRFVSSSPFNGWPYGSPTVVNPYIVTLGASPGNSSKKIERSKSISDLPYEGPTIGVHHKGIEYNDSRRFWTKSRALAAGLLQQLPETDALALYGHLNLDINRNAQAKNVEVNLSFAEWVLNTIINELKPRYLILLGLKSYLQIHKDVRGTVERVLSFDLAPRSPRFNLSSPTRDVPFSSYKNSQLTFQEWDLQFKDGRKLCVVMWPQHPSRPPFTDINIWLGAIDDFHRRHKHEMEQS